ncbi:MAG: hypothetical protein GY941_21690 [Planctomycetes bacterium]|nr:hypothetical protein [Planctomycetota bacterium]
MRIAETKDVTIVRPLRDAWMQIANGQEFGLEINAEVFESKLRVMLKDGTLLVAYDESDKPIGFFAVTVVESSLSYQKIATELYWFALPSVCGAGPRLYEAARQWAADNDCVRLMICASRLGSDLHDKVCNFCERQGGSVFETVYMMEVVQSEKDMKNNTMETVV